MMLTLLIAVVAVATAAAISPPSGIHLAYGGNESMTVSFSYNTTSSQTCVYGLQSGGPTSIATTQVRTYLGGSFHHASMGPLIANTAYKYSCAGGLSSSFTSQPAEGDLSWGGFATFGDWGYLGSAERGASLPVGGLQANWSAVPVRRLLESWRDNMTFVLHTGDIDYADDAFGEHLFEFTYETVKSGWFDWVQNISSTIPYMVSVGNHESDCHSPACFLDLTLGEGERNFTAYNTRWNMPSDTSGGVMNMWYSYSVGGVHFVALDTETDFVGAQEENAGDDGVFSAGHFGPDGAYLAWLTADLNAAAADPNIAFIVANGHRPFEDLPSDHAQTLVSLFTAAKVDVYFAGHGHSYARYDVSAWGDSTVHIMAGGAGCDEMGWPKAAAVAAAAATPAQACTEWCTAFEAQSLAMNKTQRACHFCSANGATPVATTSNYAAGFVTVSNDSLTFRLHNAPDGAILDTIVIPKKARVAARAAGVAASL